MFSAAFEQLWRQVCERPLPPLDDPGFGSGGPLDAELAARARLRKDELYGGTVFPVSPLYVTSICKERCTYCNYRAGSTDPGLRRVRLSDAELEREVRFLVEDRGLRAVELVYASDPLVTVDDICRHVEITARVMARAGHVNVGLSAEPASVQDYRRLRDAGLSFSVVWMETYDPVRYRELHPGRQTKSDFFWRLESYERMIEAGLEGVGYGVLSGLADWRRDWSMLALHQQWLRRHCGRGPNILGIPRLRPAPGAPYHERQYLPSDSAFRSLVAWHNGLFPEVLPFVSTREEFETCLQLAAGGGCLFTLNCSTVPGGYTLPNSGAQFVTGNYDAPVFAPRLTAAGLRPEWAWRPGACYTVSV
jgi:2-iminoacetate synthase